MAQTNTIMGQLRRAHPEIEFIIREIVTRGDTTQAANTPLSSFGEKGIFAKELETALLNDEIDVAVHSMKDMAHTLPIGLVIAAVPSREDPRDAWLGIPMATLSSHSKVGTGSVRRKALLLARSPRCNVVEIRGNVDNRIRKLNQGDYDAIFLAAAGLNRLGLAHHITEYLDPMEFVPDPGQGALAIETREDDPHVRSLVHVLNVLDAHVCVGAERAFLRELGGGCHTPCGALATINDNTLTLHAMLGTEDGSRLCRHSAATDIGQAEQLGRHVARELREKLARTQKLD